MYFHIDCAFASESNKRKSKSIFERFTTNFNNYMILQNNSCPDLVFFFTEDDTMSPSSVDI